eukprot:TRINITY_DN8052_c0_g1_i1.p1 TRINITY_DN8052_c0_g1~~TRINITY_DN8052_c0_g1_i1.p1  ORF type:complete len:140 (-),score=18.21 TRINITY_DN8052_c0_g1_i1:664-1083(-)
MTQLVLNGPLTNGDILYIGRIVGLACTRLKVLDCHGVKVFDHFVYFLIEMMVHFQDLVVLEVLNLKGSGISSLGVRELMETVSRYNVSLTEVVIDIGEVAQDPTPGYTAGLYGMPSVFDLDMSVELLLTVEKSYRVKTI